MSGALYRIGRKASEVLSGSLLAVGQTFAGDGNGRAVSVQLPSTLAQAGAQSQITLGTSDVSLLSTSGALTWPAGRIAAGDVLDVFAYVAAVQQSGAGAQWTAKLKVGAATLAAFTAPSMGTSASTRRMMLRFRALCTAVNAQRVALDWNVATAGSTAPYAGGSLIDTTTGAVDLSAASTVDLTLASSTATAGQTATLDQLEVVHFPYRGV